ncbi:large ribosomal RNA subunit accumulation protein YCED-like protein 2, chloroplastic isoform X2 [Senna tora]|uniref:Large ribosomal RNA subunit accumulation protein YCED-like protein 2, chloroplastic isoform X2 n=1 Tax=Senna tora TaxID=362788 RepID=A0A834WIW2_9FABA|nr:large ribosomal RNA subunit accumulation protein YCED-like protein 2, chloroplastic isoform X2 [Senna tora]
MAKSANLIPTTINPLQYHPPSKPPTLRFLPHIQTCNINSISSSSSSCSAQTKQLHSDSPLMSGLDVAFGNGKMTCRASRRLITISTGDGKWHGDWTCDYHVSLQDLDLQDLTDSMTDNWEMEVEFLVGLHASFGLSVDGRVMTSFTRKCSTCSSPYCRQIDAKFKFTNIIETRGKNFLYNQSCRTYEMQMQVIYVKPGYEADLDSLVQDTIRLTTPVKDTCCELCEKSEATLQFTGGKNNKSSVDKRWSRLLELKNRML